MEVGLLGAVLFHAFNGLRVMLIDFWSKGVQLQKQMMYVVMAAVVILMVPATYFMMRHTVETLLGS
jgi:succinate dehydrogenase / fumarate reductase cytochrome b subunit